MASVQSDASLAPSARSGAKLPALTTTLVRDGQKRIAACSADRTDSATSDPARENHKELVALDASIAVGVALMAGGNEVLGEVIEAIPVKMIGHKRSGSTRCANHPVDFAATPVASVRSPSDALKQHCSGLRYKSCLSGQRMGTVTTDTTMRRSFLAASVVCAPPRAKQANLRRRSVVGYAAVITCPLHLAEV